ncbi:MAG: hypothetical protein RH982_09150 [Parvibaculum sp.]
MNGNNSSLKYTGEAYAGVRRHLEPLLAALGSETAFKIYVLIGGLAVLCLSVAIAFQMMRELRAVQKDAFELRFRGPKPKDPGGQQKKIEAFRAAKWRNLIWRFAGLVVFGFIVPSFCLYFGAAWYSWFDPHMPAFVAGGSGEQLSNPDEWLLLAFVLNQFTHGAFMDVAEVFALDFGGIRNNPSNLPFSGAVLLYRSFIGSFAVVAFFFIRRSITILRALRDERISAPVHA